MENSAISLIICETDYSMCVTNVSVYQDGNLYTNNAFYYTPYHDYKFGTINVRTADEKRKGAKMCMITKEY